MNRVILPLSILALGGAALAGGGCSSGSVPIGMDGPTSDPLRPPDSACGSTACALGEEQCCAGPDPYCTPTCMRVSVCPAIQRPCLVDAGPTTVASPLIDAGSTTDALSSTDAGPATEPDHGVPSDAAIVDGESLDAAGRSLDASAAVEAGPDGDGGVVSR